MHPEECREKLKERSHLDERGLNGKIILNATYNSTINAAESISLSQDRNSLWALGKTVTR